MKRNRATNSIAKSNPTCLLISHKITGPFLTNKDTIKLQDSSNTVAKKREHVREVNINSPCL